MQGAGTLAEHSVACSTRAGRQFVGGSAGAIAVGDLCGPDAARVAAAGHGAPPDAFWRGWRVVAVDGTQFSLTNTPQIGAATTKARTRRGRAAFAKMTTAVLLELGLHNPLAARLGRHGESEWALAQQLLAQLPRRALFLGDRLYGVAAFLAPARAACARVDSHFLARAGRRSRA